MTEQSTKASKQAKTRKKGAASSRSTQTRKPEKKAQNDAADKGQRGAADKSQEASANRKGQDAVGDANESRKVEAGRTRDFTPTARRLRPTAAIAIAVAVGFLVWLLFIRGDDNSGGKAVRAPAATAQGAQLVSTRGLPDAIAGSGYPVYWVGPQPGDRYEVTRPADGKLQVRYLPTGERAGTKTPYLSIGSYMQDNAYKTIEKLAAKPRSTAFEVAHGGLAYVDRSAPESVYVAYPRVPTQIEVYDPHPGRAQALVRSGIVAPIG